MTTSEWDVCLQLRKEAVRLSRSQACLSSKRGGPRTAATMKNWTMLFSVPGAWLCCGGKDPEATSRLN